jgi:regulator of sigma E protease
MSSRENEELEIKWDRNGQSMKTSVSPIRDEGQRFPQLGISPPSQLTLISSGKRKLKPVWPNTPAAEAKNADGATFEPGDRVVAMTDPDDPQRKLKPVADYSDYHRRMVLLAKEDITFEVQRKDSTNTVQIPVKPVSRCDLGLRMRMGEVAALRRGGAAEGKVVAHSEGPTKRGDRIVGVLLPRGADGKRLWYVAGPVDWGKSAFQLSGSDPKAIQALQAQVTVKPLDPLLLPRQLNEWAKDQDKPQVDLVVLREAHPTDETVRVALDYDPSYRFDNEAANQPNSPLPVSGLGLAYWVEAVVDDATGPAAAAKTVPGELPTGFFSRAARFLGLEGRDVAPGGEPMPLRPNDSIIAVRLKARDAAGNVAAGEWKDDLKPHQWASADAAYQSSPPEIDLRVKRSNETIEVTVVGQPNPEWPLYDRGLIFQAEVQVQRATDVGDAMRLGGLRTVRFIKTVYMNLYAMVIGRVSAKTMSGPLTIANVSYKLAGEDFWQFLLFLGMISVNLAVVNFLPIPVLDGGHMVFLILEKILGRPVPERLFAFAMYTGLFLILSLMVFVVVLDVRRLFFGWF